MSPFKWSLAAAFWAAAWACITAPAAAQGVVEPTPKASTIEGSLRTADSNAITSTTAKRRTRIAVIDIKVSENLDSVVGESLTAVLALEMSSFDPTSFVVVSRNELRALVGQQIAAQELGCDEPQCLVDLAEAAAAEQIVSGSVAPLGEEWVFTLSLVDAATGQALRRQSAAWLGDPSGLVDLIQPFVFKLLAPHTEQNPMGALRLLGAEERADVRLDDKEYGLFPTEVIQNLSIGAHRLRVHKQGFSPIERDVAIRAGETTLVQVDMIDTASLQPWYTKWWVWTAVGVVAGGAVATTLLLLPDGPTTLDVEIPIP